MIFFDDDDDDVDPNDGDYDDDDDEWADQWPPSPISVPRPTAQMPPW